MEGEDEPALPKAAPIGDQVTAVIGEVGRWQLEKILIVFIAAAPGGKYVIVKQYCQLEQNLSSFLHGRPNLNQEITNDPT